MKQMLGSLTLPAEGRGLHDVTAKITAWLSDQEITDGLLTLYLRHTSASLIIQENADTDVRLDIQDFMDKLVPDDPSLYRHTTEGPDDMPAHIKAALTQTHLSIPLIDGLLALGTWQGIYLFEHRDQPHRRELSLHLIGTAG
ncbi:MAG: secondary thiamine-phosphate synthase enzyme YjbQ [Pseudomonadota bacterium]